MEIRSLITLSLTLPRRGGGNFGLFMETSILIFPCLRFFLAKEFSPPWFLLGGHGDFVGIIVVTIPVAVVVTVAIPVISAAVVAVTLGLARSVINHQPGCRRLDGGKQFAYMLGGFDRHPPDFP